VFQDALDVHSVRGVVTRELLASAAVSALVVSAAAAADLPTHKAPPAPPSPAPFSWTGFYLGGNLGAVLDPDAVRYDGFFTLGSTLPPGGRDTLSPTGVLGGVTGGYNWQISNLVLGLEADADFTSARASHADNGCGGLCWSHSASLPFFFDGRVRLGYAFDHLLPFVTGGLVIADVTNQIYDSPSDWGPFTASRGGGASLGWTFGGGFEYALNEHWSFKTDYLFMQFAPVSQSISASPYIFNFKFTDSAQIARIGVNYRF
jgi:outer membrane immunogenic protein